jgi:hypothetical protein
MMRGKVVVFDDLDHLADAIAPLILARIAGLLGGAASSTPYSTRKGHGPKGLSHKRWLKVAPTIPGAVRPPGARWWSVPRAAYERWVEQGCPSAHASSPAANDGAWSPAAEYARTKGAPR